MVHAWEKDNIDAIVGNELGALQSARVSETTVQEYEMLPWLLEGVSERFTIDSDGKADWAIRKLLTARNARDAEIEHHRRQINIARQQCEQAEAYFSALLEVYFNTLPTKKAKMSESYMLQSGKLRRTVETEDYSVNREACGAWLAENGYSDYSKIEYDVKWADLKKGLEIKDGKAVMKSTGEVIPNIDIVKKPAAFIISGTSEE